MRNAICAAAVAAAVSGCVTGSPGVSGETTSSIPPAKSRSYYYAKQTPRVVDSCMPAKLLRILGHIRQQTGVKPVLTSGLRKGGRKRSQHRHCNAADIRVPGVSDRRVVAVARTAPGIGGIGTYCNGIIHVDIGPRREWRYCGKRR